jgi:hypothetical protein
MLLIMMMSEAPPEGIKYVVSIKQVEKTVKITDQAKAELQSSGMMDEKGKLKMKGVSPKMLKRMKLEAVDCPVLNSEIGFYKRAENYFSLFITASQIGSNNTERRERYGREPFISVYGFTISL